MYQKDNYFKCFMGVEGRIHGCFLSLFYSFLNYIGLFSC